MGRRILRSRDSTRINTWIFPPGWRPLLIFEIFHLIFRSAFKIFILFHKRGRGDILRLIFDSKSRSGRQILFGKIKDATFYLKKTRKNCWSHFALETLVKIVSICARNRVNLRQTCALRKKRNGNRAHFRVTYSRSHLSYTIPVWK